MFYIVKHNGLEDDIEVLGVYKSLDKAKRYLVKTGNKAAGNYNFVDGNDWTRWYDNCTVGIEYKIFD